MRVGLAQYGATPDKAANLARALEVIAEAGRRGVDLLIFPEVFMVRWEDGAGPLAGMAEPLDGPFVRALGAAAAERRLHLVVGLAERAPGEAVRAYNTAVLIGPDGAVLAAYRKVHLFDAFGYRESDRIVPGSAPPPVVATALGRIGLEVCYDVRFPEWTRLLALAGAEVVAMPASWVAGHMKEDHWITLVRARALENTVWIAAADQVRADRPGRSLVVDPMGVVVADGGEEPGLVVAEIDLDRTRRVREKLPVLGHRRPELYGALATAAHARMG
ncbi:MAG: carbon-nitrogen hydrolase family protein [Armatimonadota bacterium]|nr:carbon-nitrogen hydrolase family protein [Armatimonadota bacterium]MDR7534976.1 carbon-nitrogen hydrolase family protein [Armatimonadota bacterium]